ncbi:hypothetical protein QR98_0104990 [Sarcoptes scabiei]|uniref:Uncharacterized protein n=1 Tax=Sarcoptes scabiei TaxID=52283 RepID=A0A132AN29_SARSC|nr:hypothetical protein QR98_0104990 [Sarcoptes scabiei]
MKLSISTRMNEFYENLERINSVDEIKISHNATLLKISDDLFIKNTFNSNLIHRILEISKQITGIEKNEKELKEIEEVII